MILTMLAHCSKSKHDSFNSLLFLSFIQDNSSNSKSNINLIDLSKSFDSKFNDVIAAKSSKNFGLNIYPNLKKDTWTKLSNINPIDAKKLENQILTFGIVPKNTNNFSNIIEIGTYTGTGKLEQINFNNNTLNLGSYKPYGVIAVALIAQDETTTSSNFSSLKQAATQILKAENNDEVSSAINQITDNSLKQAALKATSVENKISIAQKIKCNTTNIQKTFWIDKEDRSGKIEQ